MNFVKCGVYLQEITDKGVREEEIDVRDPAEKERDERLRKLPEFTTDPTYKSLAEQLAENDAPFPDAGGHAAAKNPFGLSKVTAEDAEFFEELERDTALRLKERSLEEEAELAVFRQSVLQLNQTPVLSGETETDAAIADSPALNHDDRSQAERKSASSTVLQQHYAWPAPRILIRRRSAEDGRVPLGSRQTSAEKSSAGQPETSSDTGSPLRGAGLQLLQEYEDDGQVSSEEDDCDKTAESRAGEAALSTQTAQHPAALCLKRRPCEPLPDAKRHREEHHPRSVSPTFAPSKREARQADDG